MAVARAVVSSRASSGIAQGKGPLTAGRSVPAKEMSRERRPRGASASRTDQNRLAELKVKIGDEDYMNGAILRIATVLSARLTLR
jgi:hypothetical protein